MIKPKHILYGIIFSAALYVSGGFIELYLSFLFDATSHLYNNTPFFRIVSVLLIVAAVVAYSFVVALSKAVEVGAARFPMDFFRSGRPAYIAAAVFMALFLLYNLICLAVYL